MTDPSPWSQREHGASEEETAAEAAVAPSPGGATAPEGELRARDDLASSLSDAQSARAAVTPLQVAAPSNGAEIPTHVATGSSNAALIPIIGGLLLVVGAVVVALLAYLDRDSGDRYPSNRGDDEYDLASMALRSIDVPAGLTLATTLEFNNAEWSEIVGAEDPEMKKAQLDSQKRIRNQLAFFTWPDNTTTEHLGQTLSVTSQSTLFETDDAAEAETNRLCGLLINEADPLEEFDVPKLADQSVGFTVTSNQEGIGKSYEVAICFRTGRIVHGVVQSGLEGTQDIGLVVRMARRMLAHVNSTFDGNPEPLDPAPETG